MGKAEIRRRLDPSWLYGKIVEAVMSWGLLMAIGGGIVLAGNVGALIWKIISPGIKVKNTVGKNSAAIERLQQHKKRDVEVLEEIKRVERAQCSAMISILNHMIDGNDIERMKKTREKLQKLLTDIDS